MPSANILCIILTITNYGPVNAKGVNMAKLSAKACGLALGIIWGAALLIMGLAAMIFPGYAAGFVRSAGSLYIGYNSTIIGSLVGALWGFIDAGIFGLLFAWLYNKLAK